ncbi:hypothetical protein LEP1GSC082_3092 [Leptospira kirschneri str. H2]|uniref:Uncharacterized protein n=2 Tax=Leptospira kirschneri TaxID=29507 RepID=A0A0E2B416_9LEPT|nr:hypothetical protein LEP1GSC081_3702 [Leptospira kirschneri str. H1]EKO62066.1 hypothetical protein LEP1GSC082_3092 [Leptospira kirschneri str. H2]EMK25117.1 hypothetical protein LEP1GSC008_2829 [Leptospira kirschneri serovar Bulgarica str. Nikolaevo]
MDVIFLAGIILESLSLSLFQQNIIKKYNFRKVEFPNILNHSVKTYKLSFNKKRNC